MAITAQQFFGGQIPTTRATVVGSEDSIKKTDAQGGPSFFQRVGQAFNSGVQQAKEGYNQAKNAENPVQLLEGGTKLASGAISAAFSPLAPIAKPIEQGVNLAAEKISNIPAVQNFANTSAGQNTARVAEDIGNVANIAGAVAGIKEVPSIISATKDTIGKVSNLPQLIKDNTIKLPKQLADSISEKITKIDPQTKNILETASIEKFNNYVKAGEQALNDPRLLTPLEQAGEKVNNNVLPAIKEDLNRIGSQKAKSLESVKNVQVPNATTDTLKFVKDAVKTSKLTPEETKLIKETISQMELGKSPTLGTLDKTVDLLQNTLYEKSKGLAIPVTSRVESIVNQAIGKLNETVKTATKKALGSDEYTILNDAYANKIELFNKLNKAVGEDAQKGGSLFKKFFSPQDSGTKKLFADIKEQYGIDLAEDATLAKFVMDSLGDTRAKSLLEQVPTSKAGAINKAFQKIEQKLTKPIPKARKIIEKRPQQKL